MLGFKNIYFGASWTAHMLLTCLVPRSSCVQLIQSSQPYPAAASAAAASSSADTPQWPGTPADGAAAVVDQQQEFASQVAALRRELQVRMSVARGLPFNSN